MIPIQDFWYKGEHPNFGMFGDQGLGSTVGLLTVDGYLRLGVGRALRCDAIPAGPSPHPPSTSNVLGP